ncbi:MAG TPA: thiamine ABC transporter substrate-binding protein [Pseudobdellovibrionaceae bacterium]|nr:thiamine ABC transporter substrate-binding protein [Pseudobdellovibrionaceae bacterium]
MAVLALIVLAVLILVAARDMWPKWGGEQSGAISLGPRLRILAYSSFVSSWGPGPQLVELFESREKVRVELVQADDAGVMLAKLEHFPSDLVIGLDQFGRHMAEFKPRPSQGQAFAWREIATEVTELVPKEFRDPRFIAFDWAPIGFVYREGELKTVPRSLSDLRRPEFERGLLLQDPRSSSPGLQFLFWVMASFGERDGFQFLRELKANVFSVTSSWSQAYGLFTRGEAPLVLSYATSPIYHALEEKDDRYRFAWFDEADEEKPHAEVAGTTETKRSSGASGGGASHNKAGHEAFHPIQIEYAAIPANCRACEVAEKFLQLMLSDEGQSLIMRHNWMLPVRREVALAPGQEAFAETFQRAEGLKTSLKRLESWPAQREALLKKWQEADL